MVPMMIETIYKRLAAADPSIPKAVLAEKGIRWKNCVLSLQAVHIWIHIILTVFAEYGVEVLEGYGMSECSPVISNKYTGKTIKEGSIGKTT